MATGSRVNTKTRAQLIAGSFNDDDNHLAKLNFATDLAPNDSITALAGGGQAEATQLIQGVNHVTVCATNNDSVKLPQSNILGQFVVVRNSGAASLRVFPYTDDKINAGAANAHFDVATGTSATFYLIDITSAVRKWVTQS